MSEQSIDLNFLDPLLRPKVCCDAVPDDFYDVNNLISSDLRKFSLGFMPFSVTKPPINLDFELICAVDVKCIKLWTKSDSLKSIGFEIFVSDQSETNFIKCASYFNLKEDGILFVQNVNAANGDNPWQNLQNFAVAQYFRNHRILGRARRVRVCIKQTNRCVPVLKKIEIWGRISHYESDDRRKEILGLIESSRLAIQIDDKDKPTVSHSVNVRENGINIPDRFLDAITYEIMSLPMVLPSGKVIDNSTLQKHNVEEEKWGRLPTDPFTGLLLTETRKPVFDTALKSQIDQYLLTNDRHREIRRTSRTVGTVQKRLSAECIENPPKSRRIYQDNSIQSSVNTINCTSTSQSNSTVNSLDEAVRKALGSRMKYSQPPEVPQTTEFCFECKSTEKCKLFYKIKLCSHLVCRECLVAKNLKKCNCGQTFENVDLIKYHRKYLL